MQNQAQQIIDSEDVLISLSEDEQDSIQGGAVFIPLVIAAVRIAAVYHARRSAIAAGRGIANAHRRVNAYGRRNPVDTGIMSYG